MKTKTKIGIILIIIISILLISFIILNKTGVINKILNNSKQEEIKKEISYEVYAHVNGKTSILVIAEDTENGIEKIIYPNNEMELYCNGKAKVAFDYNTDITGKESLTFKAINTLGEEIEKTILINDQFYLDLINYNLETETETQKALTVNYKESSEKKQYKIGEGENWTNYTDSIRLDDYQILETLGNEIREANIYLRQTDKVGNEIISQIKLSINATYKQGDTIIEGESILACVENNNLESGNYIFRVTGTMQEEDTEGVIKTKTETIEYPVELYNYNEDANYVGKNNTVVGNTSYIGMGKANSEKRMLILKYNGNLTINEGAVITPTGTSETINGATYLCTKKGMFIYCEGILTNNGEITMTARGTVNQEGENVYLYKNENNTYEYVPAIGGIGGQSTTGTGNDGSRGTIRKTGGGGSGGGAVTNGKGGGTFYSGRGGNGTSYSGGSGGGGSGQPGSSIGGSGGSGISPRWGAGGGAGNPAGYKDTIFGDAYNGDTGTGGLLIINADSIENNGMITSNGVNGGYGRLSRRRRLRRWKYKFIL